MTWQICENKNFFVPITISRQSLVIVIAKRKNQSLRRISKTLPSIETAGVFPAVVRVTSTIHVKTYKPQPKAEFHE
jgi:hypothetical protein